MIQDAPTVEELSAELSARIECALQDGRDLRDEQHAPRTQFLLRALHPAAEMLEQADHRIILSYVQKIVNSKGQRVWARYEKRYLPFDPEELEATRTPTWVKADMLDDSPAQRRALIVADQKAIEGRLKKKLYYDADIQCDMLTILDQKFTEQLERLKDAG